MSQYELKRDITSYTYPLHMKRPDGFFGSNFFEKWIPNWDKHLGHLKNIPNVVGIEIGCLHGDCSVYCAEKIANGPSSIHYCVDINENEFFKNNISPYPNIIFKRGKSNKVLRNSFDTDIADYIYIDGSHLAIDVLSDAVLSWDILKANGILIFDDYGWGSHTNDPRQKPKLGIDAFLMAYEGHYTILDAGWQVFIKKLPYVYSKEELEANFQ